MSEAVDSFMAMIADIPCTQQKARDCYAELEEMGLSSDIVDKIEQIILSYYEYGKSEGYSDGMYDGLNK